MKWNDVIQGKYHYKYVHAPELSILAFHEITLNIPAWFIFPVVEIRANLILAILSKAAFTKFLSTKDQPWKGFKLKNRNSWLTYQHCFSLWGPLLFKHHRDPLAETNTYTWPAIYIWSVFTAPHWYSDRPHAVKLQFHIDSIALHHSIYLSWPQIMRFMLWCKVYVTNCVYTHTEIQLNNPVSTWWSTVSSTENSWQDFHWNMCADINKASFTCRIEWIKAENLSTWSWNIFKLWLFELGSSKVRSMA